MNDQELQDFRDEMLKKSQDKRLAQVRSHRVPDPRPLEIDPDTGMPYGLSDLIDMGTYE